MPIAVQCSGCGGKFRAPDELAGKRVKCPKCSASIVVGSAHEQQSAQPPAAENSSPDTPKTVPAMLAASSTKTAGWSRVSVWAWIGAGGLTFLLLVALLWLFAARKSPEEKLLTATTDSTPSPTGPVETRSPASKDVNEVTTILDKPVAEAANTPVGPGEVPAVEKRPSDTSKPKSNGATVMQTAEEEERRWEAIENGDGRKHEGKIVRFRVRPFPTGKLLFVAEGTATGYETWKSRRQVFVVMPSLFSTMWMKDETTPSGEKSMVGTGVVKFSQDGTLFVVLGRGGSGDKGTEKKPDVPREQTDPELERFIKQLGFDIVSKEELSFLMISARQYDCTNKSTGAKLTLIRNLKAGSPGRSYQVSASYDEKNQEALLQLAAKMSTPLEKVVQECVTEYNRTHKDSDRQVDKVRVHVDGTGVNLESVPGVFDALKGLK